MPHPRRTVSGTPAQSPKPANRPKQKDYTMTFQLDTGNSGSEGPWLSWSARGTQDGAVPQQSFYIRDENGNKTVFDMSGGIVLDIENMKTGWQRSDGIVGQAPDWKWNASVSQMMPQPGDDYKRGFEVRCAIGGGNTATWQQAGAAVWGALTAIAQQLAQGPSGKLPLVRMTGTKPVQFKRGSTVEPVLEVAEWVDRPDCLKEGAAAGIATEPAPQQQPAQQAQQPAQQSAQPAASSVPASAQF